MNADSARPANKKAKISSNNAIPEFKQNLMMHSSIEEIKDTCSQMAALIKEAITTSFADMLYDKAADMMRVMREEMVELDEPGVYNQFVRDLKKEILAGNLGGNRVDMWKEVRKNRLGLLTSSESERSEITEEMAKEVCDIFSHFLLLWFITVIVILTGFGLVSE